MKTRTVNALIGTDYQPETSPAICALVEYASQGPSLEPRDYFSDWRDTNGLAAYRSESRSIGKDWRRFKQLVQEAATVGVTDQHVIDAAKSAYSGRYEWTGSEWSYCVGQYWPTEYRSAACAVLDQAIRNRRRETPPESRQIATVAELKRLNKQNGGCWFDPASMKFFSTRIESEILGGKYFVTSEQPPHGPRAFTVRAFDSQGSIDTVGELVGHKSRSSAIAAIREILAAK